ncbi:HEAT repeat domain-containing protein [Engelhardtia mirabilis]|uniref:HEAT repeat protein n=1 Tax=Engelhardtia mirabilis TaxID=2528011 RepID=A0A518BJK7_9BACT|nr:HEAT repeat protein [Planctomycetes bacterium Pla133]QDV01494.1 HEAT repeat protein [Planctomycetes bacterium Pla86]
MDIRFCDICNESVAQVHFDEGRAVLREGHVAVASSSQEPRAAGRAAQARSSGAEWMAAAAIVVATALGWMAFQRAEVSEARIQRSMTEDQARLAATIGGVSAGLADFDQRGEDLRQRMLGELASLRAESGAGRVRVEELAAAWQGQLSALSAEVAELRTSRSDDSSERLARIETSLARLRGDVELLGGAVIDALEGLALAPVQIGQSVPAATEGVAPSWSTALAGLSSPDAMVRWDAVDQLSRSGDAGAAEPLLPLLDDPDLVVRMSVARALSELGNPIAVPALIDTLEDPESAVREAAVVALRELTGRSMRFDPAASESDRARKVEAWRDWWERAGVEELDAP